MEGTGRLIALEGIDGAGTTTQARLLARWMSDRGLSAHLTCEPSDGPVGRLLREILSKSTRPVDPRTLALLFAADRVDHVHHEIVPRLKRGIHVVSDRYVYSSLAYQSVDLDLDWVARINLSAPEPDLTVYLRIDPALAHQRRQSRGSSEELFESQTYQSRIAASYDNIFGSAGTLGSKAPDPAGSDEILMDPAGSGGYLAAVGRNPRYVVLDGSLSVSELHHQLRNLVQKICVAC